MKQRSPLMLVVVALYLAACTTGPAASPVASPAPSSAPTSSPSAVPSASPSPIGGADTAIVRIEQTGGMLPPWITMGYYPSVAVYADGRLIMQGPQIDLYPGAALPNLVVTHITQAGIDHLLTWAQDAGLSGEDRSLGQPILDSGVTMFTVVYPDGTTHRTSVTDMSGTDQEIGALRRFQEILGNVRGWIDGDIVGDDQPYVFDRMQIVSNVADPSNVPDPQLSSTLDWPLDDPLATLGTSWGEPPDYHCALIEGEDLTTVRPMLEQANELTLWRSDDVTYQLYLRPLLPDEEACPGL